jgi:type VI protein secretion system component Hcp
MTLHVPRLAAWGTFALAIAAGSASLTAQGKSLTPIGQLSVADGTPVPIYGFSWGASNSGTVSSGGGAGAGKANVQDISISKQDDALSTALLQNTLLGTHIERVRIDVFRSGQAGIAATIQLQDAIVTSFSTGGGNLVENVTFEGTRVSYTAAGHTVCWNLAENVSC